MSAVMAVVCWFSALSKSVYSVYFYNCGIWLYCFLSAVAPLAAVWGIGFATLKERVSKRSFKFLLLGISALILYIYLSSALKYNYIYNETIMAFDAISPKDALMRLSNTKMRFPVVSRAFREAVALKTAELYLETGNFDGSLYELGILETKNVYDQYVQQIAAHDYLMVRDYDKALVAVNAALSYTPNDPELISLKGLILAHCGSYNDAYLALNKAVLISGGSTVPYLRRGYVLLYSKSNILQAEKDFKVVTDADHSNCEAYLAQAIIDIQKSDYKSASAMLDASARGDSIPCRFLPWRALLSFHRKEFPEAIKLYAEAHTKYPFLSEAVLTEYSQLHIPEWAYNDFNAMDKMLKTDDGKVR